VRELRVEQVSDSLENVAREQKEAFLVVFQV
jgi:hypothetical protein